MPKRRTRDFDNQFDSEDNPIGLTGAFAPVKGPQSVDYDADDDPVGLTQAFGAISDQDEEREWDEDSKWKDFDWDAALGEPAGDHDAEEDSNDDSNDDSGKDEADEEADASEADASEDGQDASEDSPVEDGNADVADSGESEDDGDKSKPEGGEASERPPAKQASSGSKRGRHAAPEKELSPRMKKSQRTRRVLVVLVILLIVIIAAVAFFAYRTVSGSQQQAAQQTQEQAESPRNDIVDEPADDTASLTVKQADVPDLASLLGQPQDKAIAELGRGALVTANHEVNEEGNPIKVNLNVALTDEPADSKTGTPTVYLGLAEDGAVRQAGYSASASALGFGVLSFADAVANEHVIEKTLAEIGVKIPENSAVLPANKDEYSTYASDGTTVIRERTSFEGDADVNGVPCTWSAVLSYDYTTQVVTGNLNDTVRIIYVYITMK